MLSVSVPKFREISAAAARPRPGARPPAAHSEAQREGRAGATVPGQAKARSSFRVPRTYGGRTV